MSSSIFHLREIQPADSPRLARLITGFDDDLTTHFQVDPYAAIVHGTEFRTTGVVVEAEGISDFVGMGTVRFSNVHYNGEMLPLAFLDGLKVQKEFRGKGLGYQIASWRIQKARETFGEQCIIGTGMLHDNHASHAVASKWCREFVEAGVQAFFVPARADRPKSVSGIAVHQLESREYEEFTAKQNKYYSQFQFYPPCSPDSIAQALAVSVEGRHPYRYYAVVDRSGNLVAGAQTWARGLLKCDTINHLPTSILALNKLMHFLPADLTIRDIAVNGLWYESGQERAAQYLWEMIRWSGKDQGNILAAGFDTRDPAVKLIRMKPWYQPRPRITYAIHAPTPLNRDQLLFSSGRV